MQMQMLIPVELARRLAAGDCAAQKELAATIPSLDTVFDLLSFMASRGFSKRRAGRYCGLSERSFHQYARDFKGKIDWPASIEAQMARALGTPAQRRLLKTGETHTAFGIKGSVPQIHKALKRKGRNPPGLTTVYQRLNKGQTLEQAFRRAVPSNFQKGKSNGNKEN